MFFWNGIIGVSALILGYFLASSVFFIAIMVAGFGWLMLLPYHAQIAYYLSLATFGSALILPFLPGRPYVWEFAALLAWSGSIMTVTLRRYSPDFLPTLRANRLIFTGIFGYCVVLVATMLYRGVGLRIFGSETVGGRFYFQQLACAIFPLLFSMIEADEKSLVRIIKLQWFLTTTYVLSDVAFSIAPDKLLFLLYFLELANDALNFEVQSLMFGIRRYQSLAIFGQGMVFLMLAYFPLRDFLQKRILYMLPALVGIGVLSLMSGHRWVVIIVVITIMFVGYAQRFFTMRNVMVLTVMGLLAFSVLFLYSSYLPSAAQRAVSFIPGLRVENQARIDADSTMIVRNTMFRVGMRMIPDYLWVGRGFTRFYDDPMQNTDPTTITAHVNQGKFYNGFVGLMINTGLFGTLFMLLFILGGSASAWRIIKYLRANGCDDSLTRVSSIVAGYWMASVLAFLVLHGDSEFAMRTFSLQAGMLILCNKLLGIRQKAQQS